MDTLQAVSTKDGKLLWSFETMREFETVNKVKARGGSISAPGPIVADGMVFVGSGYAILGGTPGNVAAGVRAEVGVSSAGAAGRRSRDMRRHTSRGGHMKSVTSTPRNPDSRVLSR